MLLFFYVIALLFNAFDPASYKFPDSIRIRRLLHRYLLLLILISGVVPLILILR